MNEPLKNLIAGVLLAGLGLWIWIYTGTFPSLQEGHPGPALFPRIIAVGLALSGLGLVASCLQRRVQLRRAARPGLSWTGLARLLLGLGLVALYPLAQAGVGFIPAVAVLSFVVAYTLKARPFVAALTALLSALLLYGTFTGLLGVPL